jgi:hypothetical protein
VATILLFIIHFWIANFCVPHTCIFLPYLTTINKTYAPLVKEPWPSQTKKRPKKKEEEVYLESIPLRGKNIHELRYERGKKMYVKGIAYSN